MKPNELSIYTFIDGGLSMDVYVSLEQRNVYMKQTEIAKLLEIDRTTVTKAIKRNDDFQMGQCDEIMKICTKSSHVVTTFYGLKIIKEIGEKYNQERIKKLEDWLEQIIVENTQEVVDDNFEIVRYNQDNLDIPVRYDKENNLPWMTQKEISMLYGTDVSTISRHINDILQDDELVKNSVVANYAITGMDGKTYNTKLYCYDMILAIGYRTRTSKAINFRNWATSIIKKYIKDVVPKETSNINYLVETNSHIVKAIDNHSDRLDKLEKAVESLKPKYMVYYRNQSFGAYLFLSAVIATASKEVFVIDPYADRFTLSILDVVSDNIKIFIVLDKPEHIDEEQQETFSRAHLNTNITLIKNSDEHDRFIFIDRQYGFEIGQSINTLGYYEVNINKINDKQFIKDKINKCLSTTPIT